MVTRPCASIFESRTNFRAVTVITRGWTDAEFDRFLLRFFLRCGFLQNEINFPYLEAGDGNIKVKIERAQMLQLDREDGMVPAGFFCQLVIGQNVGSNLILRQTIQAYGGNFPDGQEFCRLDATVACNDHSRAIYKNRIGEAEGTDAVRDLTNLALRMDAGVHRIRDKILNFLVGNI